MLCADPRVTLLTSKALGGWESENAAEAILESPPGLEEGNVCFIFCLALQGLLGAGVFLLASHSASLNTVAFSP